jgi:uncharacterized protein (TIGR02118 family)
MAWLASIWVPNADAVVQVAAEWSRWALGDQGPYGRGAPFDLLIGGPGAVPKVDWPTLGDRVFAWSVDEIIVIEAATVPAVTMVSLMRRNPALTRDEFVTHWLDRHAPLAKRRHVGLVDYRQWVVTETVTPETPTIDGIALLGFASRSDFETKFFDSDEGRAEIMADVARFMDRPGPETTLVGPPV